MTDKSWLEIGFPNEDEMTVDELRSKLRMYKSVIRMAVLRLEGTVEGRLTHEGNFLQRIDELRRIEGAYLMLKAEGKA